MRATRTNRSSSRRSAHRSRAGKHVVAKRPAKPARPGGKPVAQTLEPALYRLCRPGWAVIVERTPNATGTRFVCPFCPQSHRVPGPVRGFKKIRRAPWGRLRRVEE